VGTTDFSPQITKIRDLNPPPDIIQTAMYEPELPAFVKQLRAAGVHTQLYLTDASDTPATQDLGPLIKGTIFTTYGFPTPGSSLAGFYKKYQDHYGHPPPNVLPAIGYDSMNIIADAVKRANTADPAAVEQALAATRGYHGVLGLTSYGGSASTTGFPVRPIAVQQWVYDSKTQSLNRKLLQLATVPPDKVPPG
jgi:branched-chain amino acid transport system substrate-binding protein